MPQRSGTVPNTTTPSTEQVVPANILPNTALPTEQAVPANFPAVPSEPAATVNNDMDTSDEGASIFQSSYPPNPYISTVISTPSPTDYVDAGEEYITYYSSDDECVAPPRTRRLDNEAEFYARFPEEYQEYLEASVNRDSPPSPEEIRMVLEEIEMERQLTLHYALALKMPTALR